MQLSLTEIGRRIAEALSRHASQSPMNHGPKAVQARLASLSYLPLPSYTDATRPDPASVPAGSVIYNSTDGGLNVSNGTNWRGPGPDGGWVNT
jgi:hypothetical protein